MKESEISTSEKKWLNQPQTNIDLEVLVFQNANHQSFTEYRLICIHY